MFENTGIKFYIDLLLQKAQPGEQKWDEPLFPYSFFLPNTVKSAQQTQQAELGNLGPKVVSGHILHIVCFVQNDSRVSWQDGDVGVSSRVPSQG